MAASQPQPSPSFFIILFDRSAPHVEIPRDFVRKHLKNKIPTDPIIRSANGGCSWNVKIQKTGENYCFTHGWSNVVKDINLGYGDFLFFKHVDRSTFKMFVYGVNACEKILPPKITVIVDEDDVDVDEDVVVLDDDDVADDVDEVEDDVDDDEDDDDDDIDGDIDGEDGDPFFTKTLTVTHKTIMRLNPMFLGLAGIDEERPITIKNLDGEEWSMKLRFDKKYNRYHLTHGWCKFVRDNSLSKGDKCVFKFIPSEDKLCLAKVTKKRGNLQSPLLKMPARESARVQFHGGDEWDGEIDENGDSLFTTVLSSTNIYVLRLPRNFVDLAGLAAERDIMLKSCDGKDWEVGLRSDRVAKNRYCLSKGWQKFRQIHNLSEGDKCVFKYIKMEDKLCLVQVCRRNGSSGEKATEVPPLRNGGVDEFEDGADSVEVVKRGRGRPRN